MSLRVQINITLYLQVLGNKAKISSCSLSSTDSFFVWTVLEDLRVQKFCLLRKTREEAFSFPRSLGWSSFLLFARRNPKCYVDLFAPVNHRRNSNKTRKPDPMI